METSGTERLRRHLRRHNRNVLGLTIATVIVAAGLWVGLYFVVWWLFLLGGTVATPDFQPVPGRLLRGFIATGALLCAFAWVSSLLRPSVSPQDRKNFWEHCLDVVLAVPRVTLSIFGTGGAVARLSDEELEYAWNLLRMMEEAGKPVAMQELPVEIPDRQMRRRIVTALQLSGLIEVRSTRTGRGLVFRNEEARRLAQERVRLRG